MQMVKKESVLSTAAIECWQTTSDPGDWNQLSSHKTKKGRRKRLEFQRLKSTHQNVTVPKKEHFDNDSNESKVNDFSSEISLSLSSSSSPASSSSDHSSESDVIVEGKSDFGNKPRKKSDNKSFTCEPYGAVSVIGRRREMEDTMTIQLNFLSLEDEEMNYENINYDFFAVYDGHGGSRVAEACRNRLHNIVAKEAEEMAAPSTVERKEGGVDWEKVMAASFEKMDEEVNGSDERFEVGRGAVSIKTIGSTAVVAVVGKEKVVVANCGDSRAVICRGGEAVALSNDHKPERPDELERVEAAGGRVIHWNGHRVLGVLATSRSIGDHYLKPFVTSEPEVTVWERSDSDEFVILASDGLWDVVTNEAACQIVRRCLDGRMRRRCQQTLHKSVNESRAAEAASVLTELAMSRGSKDNISVIVVELRKRRDFS